MAYASSFDPTKFFGTEGAKGYGLGNWWSSNDPRFKGAGAVGLPSIYGGWSAAARNAVPFSLNYLRSTAPINRFYKQELGKDYSGQLFGLSKDVTESQLAGARTQQSQAFTRAGFGGGGGTSPLAGAQLQNEAMARSGALGLAARQAVLQAQAMKLGAATGYQNFLAQRLSGMLIPAQIQAGTGPGGPVGPLGPSLVGPSYQLGAGIAGGFA